jgi:hypothetical protein
VFKQKNMGGSSSVSVKTVNEIVTDSIIAVTKSCSAAAANKYDLYVDYVEGDVLLTGSVTQTARVKSICDQNSNIQSAVKAEMMNKVKALSESKDTNLFTGDVGFFNSASSNVNSTNRALMKMSIQDSQHCIITAQNKYKVELGKITGNLTIDQVFTQEADADMKQCLLESGIEQNLAFDLEQDIDATSKRKGTLDSILEQLVPLLIALGVVGAIVFGVVMYFKYRKQPLKPDAPASASVVETNASASSSPTITVTASSSSSEV